MLFAFETVEGKKVVARFAITSGVKMNEGLRQFGEDVRAYYGANVAGATSRVDRGEVLWAQFECALERCLADGQADTRQLTERVNELAVAKEIAQNPDICGQIVYEHNLLPDGRKIDFVIFEQDRSIYVEVKTVHPRTKDEAAAWAKYERCRAFHPENVNFTVGGAPGGAIYQDTFAARSSFLGYSLKFESRLAAAKHINKGAGILVFCGNDSAWSLDDLEDFADYYHTDHHRQDDPFALMEQHHIAKKQVKLLRNIDHFACLQRAAESVERQAFTIPVKGPSFAGPHQSATI